ncbi:hypothetical protein [Streptomyces chryseus]|uniref:hypothetical protein n=1 Tax=Streptomyces chryseus TaxID=68186 RepID=UPI00110F88E5|nr:hypothetical protein [Streptomyces chryseus]GGX02075.1 hypothetical protein GCM10010353_17160 [Streptomyces chryseus]
MTTLHLSRADIARLVLNGRGDVTIRLTDQAARDLVDAAAVLVPVEGRIESRQERRSAHLASLSNEQLVQLAESGIGGPEDDVTTEISDRIRRLCDGLPGIVMRKSGKSNPA